MNEKHYETILAALADKIEEQAREIGYLKWKNGDLEKKLSEAENEGQKKTSTKIEIR